MEIVIAEEIRKISEKTDQATLLKEQMQAIASEISGGWKSIRDTILSGKGTTGSNIRDFVIVECGRLDSDFEVRLSDIQKKIAACQSEYILVIQSSKTQVINREPVFGAPFPPDNDFILVPKITIGIINSDSLLLDFSKRSSETFVEIPTGKCAVCKGHSSSGEKFFDENLKIRLIDFFENPHSLASSPEFFIGNKEVAEKIRNLGYSIYLDSFFDFFCSASIFFGQEKLPELSDISTEKLKELKRDLKELKQRKKLLLAQRIIFKESGESLRELNKKIAYIDKNIADISKKIEYLS